MEHNYNQNRTRTTTTTTTTSSSSSSSNVRARTREGAELNVLVESVRELYQDAIGQPMSPICEKSLRSDLATGTPYIYYHYALVETAYAPRPSWRYTLTIVARLKNQMVSEESLFSILSLRDSL